MNRKDTNTTGLLVIISGPSGVGKTTIAHHVERELGGVFSVSMTTRPKTVDDTEAVDYYFVDQAGFEQVRDTGGLLEWAKVFDHFYGTPSKPVNEALGDRKLMILEIDVQGAIQVKQRVKDAYAIFVLPPSEPALLERLRHRKREDEPLIQRRFQKAKQEIVRAKKSGVYDVFLVNDDLSSALNEAVGWVQRERKKRCSGASGLSSSDR